MHRRPLPVWGPVVETITLEPQGTGTPAPASQGGPGTLEVSCADPSATIAVFDPGRREVGRGHGLVTIDALAPGAYTVRLTPVEAPPTSEDIQISPGARTKVRLSTAGPAAAEQTEMLGALGLRADSDGMLHTAGGLDALGNARLGTLLAHAAFATYAPGLEAFNAYRSLGVGAGLLPTPGKSGVLAIVGASGESPAPGFTADAFAADAEIALRNLEGEPLGPPPLEPLTGMPSVAQAQLELDPGMPDGSAPGCLGSHPPATRSRRCPTG